MTNDELHAAIMNLPRDAEARLQQHSPAELFAYLLGHRDARHAAAELAVAARPLPQATLSEEREALQRAEKALTRLANIDCGCVPCTGQCRTGPAAEMELEGRMEYAHTEALAARAVLAAARQVPAGDVREDRDLHSHMMVVATRASLAAGDVSHKAMLRAICKAIIADKNLMRKLAAASSSPVGQEEPGHKCGEGVGIVGVGGAQK